MNQWTLSASAPALLITLLLASAAPAAALTDTVKDSLDALPSARSVPGEAEALAGECAADPADGCAAAAAERAGTWTSPARAWVQAFRADPVGVLVSEAAGLGGELAEIADTFTTWLGGKLDEHGVPHPFGGGP